MGSIRNRQDKLIKLIELMPLTVRVIAEKLGVCNETIWNDIDYLSSRGRLTIKHDVFGMTVSAA